MTIIEKNRYGLPEQSGSQDQINSMISVDIARRDLKTTNTCNNLNGLVPGCRELQLNPVVTAGEVASPGMNADDVRTEVAVEIRDRKRQPRSN
jgi:hypothetical protein